MTLNYAQEIRELVCELQGKLNPVCSEPIRTRLETIYKRATAIVDEQKEEARVNETLEA